MSTCLDNNCLDPRPDYCLSYTGVSLPALGLTQYCSSVGDVLTVLLQKAQVADVSASLQAQLTTLGATTATLQSRLTALSGTVNTAYTFDPGCLQPASSSRDALLQAAVTKLCAVNTTLTTLATDYVKASELTTLVQGINTPDTPAVTSYNSRMVPFVAYEYYGPLSNFDLAGKGLPSAGFDKVYLCNGDHGTPDRRGRAAVGAVRNVPGGSLSKEVDPTLAANPNTNYSLKDVFGGSYTALSVSQLPSHNHGVTDSGHTHGYSCIRHTAGGNADPNFLSADAGTDKHIQVNMATTGISINPTGGGQPVDLRTPAIAAYYIMYLP